MGVNVVYDPSARYADTSLRGIREGRKARVRSVGNPL